MAHYPDQARCDYLDCTEPEKLLAVGWLDPAKPFAQGAVHETVVKKLAELLVDPWQPAVAIGKHNCAFCRFTGGPGVFRLDHCGIQLGASNVFVPADGFLYLAPSLILHYIDSHCYAPLDDFQQAVSACPPMRSVDYLKAILKNGPKGFSKGTF